MMRQCLLVSLVVPLCAAGTQPIVSFFDFRNPAGLSLTGSAQTVGHVLRLTQSERHLAGAAWFRDKQPVSNGFETTFQFQLTLNAGLGHGADGLAFVLQNSGPSALGGAGSGGGFALGDGVFYGKSAGIPQSIAVFFDTFRNEEIGDPSNNFVTICTAGTPKEMRWPPPRLAYTKKLPVNLKDGKIHTARIVYQRPVLTVFLENARVLVSTVDLSTVIGPDGAAWVGFTASTGNGYENRDILSWSFSRPHVSSDISVVSSEISFLKTACLPDRNLCTPERETVEQTGPGVYHIVLPASVEWGGGIPNPGARAVAVRNARGTVCHDVERLGAAGCTGPGRSAQRTRDGRTSFSTGAPGGHAAEGYFEFDARIE